MFGEKLSQQVGNEGSAYQAGRDLHVTGVTYTEARQIAIDVWKANAIEFTDQAISVARARVDEFLDNFFEKLHLANPSLLNSFKEPAMQMVLFDAQKQYAKSGDKYTAELLTDFLIARAGCAERSWEQIVIDESLSVIPRLTTEMMNKLAAMFLANQGTMNMVSFEQWEDAVVRGLKPVVDSIFANPEHLAYLTYLGCVEMLSEKRAFTDFAVLNNVKIMYDGMPLSEFEEKYGSIDKYEDSFELSTDRLPVVKFASDSVHFSSTIINNHKNDAELRRVVSEFSSDPRNDVNRKFENSKEIAFLSSLQSRWLNSPLIGLSTTPIGALIGQAHLKMYSGLETKPLL